MKENLYGQQLSDYNEGIESHELSIDQDDKKIPEKQLWIIDGYRIWATNYEQAVQSAMMIERF